MRASLFLLLLVAVSVMACGPVVPPSGGDPAASGVFVVVSVPVGGPIPPIPVAFANAADKPIKYAVNADGATMYDLGAVLYQDGKVAVHVPSVAYDEPPFKMSQVRVLEPRSVIALKLRTRYIEMPPGFYELRLTYHVSPGSVDETQFGLTPLKFEQTVYLDVQKK